MTRVFLDINIALDLIVGRKPFHDEAKYLLEIASNRTIKLMISSGAVANMIFNARKYELEDPNCEILKFLEICDVVNAYKSTLFIAFHSKFRDKEDAAEYFTALDNHADYFLTRDVRDYKRSISPILPVITPIQFKDKINRDTIFASSFVNREL